MIMTTFASININNMYCTKCGKEIPDGSTFSSHCGHKVISNDPGDNLRKGIFSIGRFLKDFVIRACVCAIICFTLTFIFSKFSISLIGKAASCF